jgi:hypothetical protein
MHGSALPLVQSHEMNDESGALRQWVFFPKTIGGPRQTTSSQTFRLVVETAKGRLVIATVALRTAPDINLAASLARLIDERPFELASRERISGEFGARHGITLELLDINLDHDDPLTITAAIPRAIALAAKESVTAGAGRIPLSELRTLITGRLTNEWITTREEFIDRLDRDAVAQARTIDGLRPSSYSYLSTVSSVHRRNRAQAMAAFPLLQPVLMTHPFDAVRHAIDQSLPLIDVLAAHHQAPKAMIRALRGVTTEDLGKRAGQLATLIKLLREIPPDWWPRDGMTWRQFANAVDAIAQLSRQPITTAANQLWLRRCAQNGYQLPATTPEDLLRLGQDIDEFLDALRRALYWALPDPRKASSPQPAMRPIEIAAQFRAGVGLDRLSTLVRRFGDAYRRAVAEFAEEAELWRGVRWPSTGGEPHVYGVVEIVPLLSPKELQEEGDRMANCVATYVEKCVKGKSQIWSLRHDDGVRLSTLETRIQALPNGLGTLHVVQHKGYANKEPPEVARTAAQAHVVRLSNSPAQIKAYLDWKHTISRQPLAVRQRHALMQPVITALERTLSGTWSWQRLLEMGGSAAPKAGNPGDLINAAKSFDQTPRRE